MGWEHLHIADISVTLDSHGGEKQRRHDAIYRELQRKIRELCLSEPYSEIVDEYSLPDGE